MIVISVIYVVFDDGSSSFDENPVTNSGLDASVYQVEQFLDDNLNDPDSSMTPSSGPPYNQQKTGTTSGINTGQEMDLEE